MINTEIYVENQKLDLTKDLSTEFTYNIDDIKDFSSRNTNFSKTIVLPGNAVNNKVFGHIFEFGSANEFDPALANVGYNFNASKAANCIVFVDKVQVFKGILRMLEIILDNGTIEYECVVFGELGGFVAALGNDKLEDLDFSQYDHVWNMTNITGSWNSVQGSGYYYPLIDYGQVSISRANKHDWTVQAFRPALYLREYMDKIINGSGYTYESSFFNSAVFRRLIIPQNGKFLIKNTTKLVSAERNSAYIVMNLQNTSTENLKFDDISLAQFTQLNNESFTYTGTAVANTVINLNLYGVLNLSFTGFGTAYTTLRFDLYKGSTVLATKSFNNTVGAAPSLAIPYLWTDTLNAVINPGETLRVEVNYTMSFDPSLQFLSGNVESYGGTSLKIDNSTSVTVPVEYGDSISINDNIPKGIFQKDFFASIIKMFNMYVVEDPIRAKHLIIKPYIEFYDFDGQSLLAIDDFNSLLKINDLDNLLLEDGAIRYIDWTYKVDRSKPIRIKPMSELNGRYFEFKYKNDADYYNEQYQKKYSQAYGTRIEDSGYDFAKEKQTAEIIFAPTPLVGYNGEDKVFSTIFKLNNNVEDVTEHVIRILQAKKITGVTSYAVKNGGTTLANLTTYGYAGHVDDPDAPQADLNFGTPAELYFELVTPYPTANLFNAYWSEYISEITDKNSKLLSAFVYLKLRDIQSLDFAKLIYIDGALWRLNSIQDYNPKDIGITKADFLKVIETTYE
jgi:hypothetical protein